MHTHPPRRHLAKVAAAIALAALTATAAAPTEAATRRAPGGAAAARRGAAAATAARRGGANTATAGIATATSAAARTANAATAPVVTVPRGSVTPFTAAPTNQQLAVDITAGQPVVREGSVSQLAGQTVSVGGQRTITIGALADQVLAPARQQQRQVVAARTALFADPVVTETVKETADATIFVSTDTFTVVDGTTSAIPELKQFRPKQVRLNQLNARQRQAFDAYKATLASKPAGHPLKVASAQGDQALLDALGQGKVDVTHTITVRVDKTPTPASGRYQMTSTQRFDTSNAVQANTVQLGPSHGTASGTAESTAKFLTGWSLGDSIHWGERTDFGIAWVEVGVHAGYTFGLRVPVVLKGTMTPSAIVRSPNGAPWGDTYDVTIHDVAAIDGDADHYKGTGLDNSLVKDGKELVLEADAYAYVKGEVLGANFNERFPKKPLFDEGRQMTPPYGDCGISCGLNFFFPCSLTKTCINVLGIIEGGAQVGFNVGGTGSVSYDYQSLVDGQVVASTRGNGTTAANTHRVTTDGKGSTNANFHTPLPADADHTVSFGYRLSNPSYTWDVALTPIVQANATFDYVVGEADLVLGPYPLPISINLGTIELPTHAGTQVSADKVPGTLRTNIAPAVSSRPGVSVAPVAIGTSTTTPTRNAGATVPTVPTVGVTVPPVAGTAKPRKVAVATSKKQRTRKGGAKNGG